MMLSRELQYPSISQNGLLPRRINLQHSDRIYLFYTMLSASGIVFSGHLHIDMQLKFPDCSTWDCKIVLRERNTWCTHNAVESKHMMQRSISLGLIWIQTIPHGYGKILANHNRSSIEESPLHPIFITIISVCFLCLLLIAFIPVVSPFYIHPPNHRRH